MISFQVNGKKYSVDVPPDTPLLWVIRDHLKLTGTKFGCGIGECGSCTVHIDGKAHRSCVTAVGDVQGKKITTIEGLPARSSREKGMDTGAGTAVRLVPARYHDAGRFPDRGIEKS